MADDSNKTGDTLRDKFVRAMPAGIIIALFALSMSENPVFSGRPATDAKLYAVYLCAGLIGLLLYLVIIRQHQRIVRLEQRLAQLASSVDQR
jgi:hypothetical protein